MLLFSVFFGTNKNDCQPGFVQKKSRVLERHFLIFHLENILKAGLYIKM